MTAYAITAAARTTAPVTWTSNGNVITVENWPTNFHAAYASDAHTATVTELADSPQVTPAITQTGVSGGSIGLSGGALVGLAIIIWFAAKWKHHGKDEKKWFVLGVVATTLIGSWGLFGALTSTVRSTGDSVGNSVGNTLVGQQTSYGR